MELNEITDLIHMNMVLYKNSAKPLSEQEIEATASVWFYHFKDYDSKFVKKAFLAAHAVCTYPIQPADIFKQMSLMQKQAGESTNKLWETLKKTLDKVPKYLSYRKNPLVIGIDEKTGRLIKSDGTKELNALYENLPQEIKSFFSSVNGMVDFSLYSDEELERYKKKEFNSFVENLNNPVVMKNMITSGENASLMIENKKD